MSIANLEQPNNLNLFCNSLTFASGGSSTPFSYQELNFNATLSGIWATPIGVTMKITKAGNIVTIFIPDVLATANTAATITVSPSLPAGFYPVNGIVSYFTFPVLDNGIYKIGSIAINTVGTLTFEAGWNSAGTVNFVGTGNSGVIQSVVAYSVPTF